MPGKSLAILDGKTPSEPVVTDVSDSIREADFTRFYSIHPGGMEPGVRAYSTLGKPRWSSIPGKPFPSELLGGDVVGTFSADRLETELELTLEVGKPSIVYVMLDSRSQVPAWLKHDFVKTTHQLRCGPWGVTAAARGLEPAEDGVVYVTYEVWSRTVAKAGPVVLGAPHPSDKPQRLAMYGIVVKATE